MIDLDGLPDPDREDAYSSALLTSLFDEQQFARLWVFMRGETVLVDADGTDAYFAVDVERFLTGGSHFDAESDEAELEELP